MADDQPSFDTTTFTLEEIPFSEPEFVYSRSHHYRSLRHYEVFMGITYAVCAHIHDGHADVQAVPIDLYRSCLTSNAETWEAALASCTKRARLAEGLQDAKRLGFKVQVMRAGGTVDAWVTAVTDGLIETTEGTFRRADGYSVTGLPAYVCSPSMQALELELGGASERRFVPAVRAGLDFTDLEIVLHRAMPKPPAT